MTPEERRLKAQLDANTAALSRTQMQLQALNHRLQTQPHGYSGGYSAEPEPVLDDYPAPQITPNQVMAQAISQKAAMDATQAVEWRRHMRDSYEDNVRHRMDRLVDDFPALKEDGSPLVNRARAVYARVSRENPGIDEATRYELAVREAAAAIGARPVTTPAEEDAGWTMGGGHNPALPSKSTRSRLTPAIIQNARLLGIDVDPKTRNGQVNLKELSEYSARFNADRDESHVKYR